MTRLNIALVQYDPRFRDVQGNMQRVDKMIARLTPELVDILLLPEMAFTGYMFASRVEIDPFLESEDGPSISWAQRTAKRLQATILVGYPERDRISGNAFNSIAVVDYEGRLQTIYRKHFLYDTDKSWCTEGPAFQTFDVRIKGHPQTIKAAPAICMDLNPKDFVAPFELFEFASHAKTEKAQLVLCCMNWLVSEPPEDSGEPANNPPNNPLKPVDEWENVKDTLSYWALRMHPMMGSNAIFVGCNRVGTERGTTFTGSSCIMKLGEHPLVYEHASKTGEQVIMASVYVL